MSPRTGVALLAGAAIVAAASAALLLRRRLPALPDAQQVETAAASAEQGQDVSVVLDFSASFAPYGLEDQLAIDKIGGAIEELSTKHWKPPITIVWTRIGTASLLLRPICDVTEFSPRLTDASLPAEELRKGLARCLSEAKALSTRPEGHTDISGAIARAVRGRENSRAAKYLLIFSDFKEDQAADAKPADFRLDGTTVLMVHRPGKDETGMPAYLDRIRQWAKRSTDCGAKPVLDVPLDLMSRNDLVQLLAHGSGLTGSAVTILADFKDQFRVGTDDAPADTGRVAVLGRTVARMANGWAPPVTVRIGVVGNTALHMRWVQPMVFEPRLNPVAGRLNRVEDLEMAVGENLRALRKFAPLSSAEADMLGAISYSGKGSQLEGLAHHLVLVSDFAEPHGGMPAALAEPMRGVGVVLVWRPSSRDAADEQGFFSRIDNWKRLFERAQARSACALEMATLTEHSVRNCLETK